MMSRWYQPVFRTRLALHRHSVQEFITTRQGMADLARHHLNFAGMELPRGNDLRALGRMAYCLDAMAVGIQHEGAVIMRVIIWPQPWFAIVSPTIGKRRQVEGVDRCAVWSSEAKMRAGNGRPDRGFARDGEFDAERARRRAVVGPAVVAKIDDAQEPERAQGRVVKTATAVNVADTYRDVIEQDTPLAAPVTVLCKG
jgi:hypothetical protein